MAVAFPPALFEWAMSNLVTLAADLGDKYPACEPDLTPEIMLGLNIASHHYDLAMAATAERFRVGAHEVMADLLDEVDFIFCSTNPDVAFGAEGPMPTKVGDVDLMERFGDIMRVGANQGNLTFPANFSRQPGRVDPGRAPSTAFPWACRSSAATTRRSSSSTWRSSPSASGPGPWWPRGAPH